MAKKELGGMYVYFNNIDIVRKLVENPAKRCVIYDTMFDFVRYGKTIVSTESDVLAVFEMLLPLLKCSRRKGLKDMRSQGEFSEKRSKKCVCFDEKNFGFNGENFTKNNAKTILTLNSLSNSLSKEQEQRTRTKNKNKNNKEREIYKERESDIFEVENNSENLEVVVLPTLAEIENFVSENNLKVLPKVFYHFYNGKNWKVKNEPIDWKEKILEWEARGAGRKNIDYSGGLNLKIAGGGGSKKNKKLDNERDYSGVDLSDVFDDLTNVFDNLSGVGSA